MVTSPCAPHATGARRERRDRRERRRGYRKLAHWRWALGGRRRAARSRDDAPAAVPDWYHPGLLALGLGIVLLSAFDAMLSAVLFEIGAATEANPIAAGIIGRGFDVYVTAKMVATGVAVVWMVMFSRTVLFGRVPMRAVMYALLGLFALLGVYQLTLLAPALAV